MGEDTSRNRSSVRRWSVLIVGAVCASVAIASAVVLLSSPDDERQRLQEVITNQVLEVSPDAVPLLREAGETVDGLIRRFPHSGDALEVAASLYRSLGATEDATRCWQRCMELDPTLAASCHGAIGSMALEQGDMDTAALHFRMASQHDPDSPAHCVHLAEVLTKQGKLREAIDLLEQNRKKHPRSMAISAMLGQAYLQHRDYEKAKQHLELAVRLGPDYTNAYYGLAKACTMLGFKEEAKEHQERFKELKARDEQRHRDELKTARDVNDLRETVAQTYAAAGKVYCAHGDVQTAESHLVRGIQALPSAVECRTVLAWLYERQERKHDALAVLAELEGMATEDLGTQMIVASAYARLGRFEQAEKAYQRAIQLAPHQADIYAALANLYLHSGKKVPEAQSLAEKAVELEPVAEYFFLLGMTCRINEDLAGAASAAEQAVALDPDNDDYRRLQEAVRATRSTE